MPVVALRRSWRGLAVGVAAFALIGVGLVVWAGITRGDRAALMSTVLAGGVFVIGVVLLARMPHTVELHDDGLVLHAYGKPPMHIAWRELSYARLAHAPRGAKPLVVTIKRGAEPAVMVSEAEYPGASALADALLRHAPAVLEDDRRT